jgi:galactokinase
VQISAERLVVRAPGRVNLIGDHTDYQAGLCFPIAIDREVRIELSPRRDSRIGARSADLSGAVDLPADGSAEIAGVEPAWGRTVAAALAVLARRGRPPVGFDAEISSTLPIGAGLSSSAALGVALTLAAAAVAALELAPVDLALAAQEAEHLASGVPCGVLDQLASVCGRAGHALLLDCRTLEAAPVAIPPTVEILVVHSGLERRLEVSEYAIRRAACEAAAARIGVDTLRDATIEQVADDPMARHVVTENARVAAFAEALRRGDTAACGALMVASHRSLRDDFGVSTPELDMLVDLCVDAGALGARLTGAGFGGCVVALLERGAHQQVATAVTGRYRAETGREPDAFLVQAVDGAALVTSR